MSQRVLSTALMAIMKKPSREWRLERYIWSQRASPASASLPMRKGRRSSLTTMAASFRWGRRGRRCRRRCGCEGRSRWFGLLCAGGFVRVGRGAKVVVDVERIDLRLPVDAGLVGVAAVQFEEFDGFDFERTVGTIG